LHLGDSPTLLARDIEQAKEIRRKYGAIRETLISRNLRLVVSVAMKYQGPGFDLEHLIQEGNLGLMRGIDKFDPGRGFKLGTYVTWWIRQAISRSIVHERAIRLPDHLQLLFLK